MAAPSAPQRRMGWLRASHNAGVTPAVTMTSATAAAHPATCAASWVVSARIATVTTTLLNSASVDPLNQGTGSLGWYLTPSSASAVVSARSSAAGETGTSAPATGS